MMKKKGGLLLLFAIIASIFVFWSYFGIADDVWNFEKAVKSCSSTDYGCTDAALARKPLPSARSYVFLAAFVVAAVFWILYLKNRRSPLWLRIAILFILLDVAFLSIDFLRGFSEEDFAGFAFWTSPTLFTLLNLPLYLFTWPQGRADINLTFYSFIPLALLAYFLLGSLIGSHIQNKRFRQAKRESVTNGVREASVRWPLWLRWGLILAIIAPIATTLLGIFSRWTVIAIVIGAPLSFLARFSSFIPDIYLALAFYFLTGALVGFIIQKIKRRKIADSN